jgi:hypothetical protein
MYVQCACTVYGIITFFCRQHASHQIRVGLKVVWLALDLDDEATIKITDATQNVKPRLLFS